MKPLIKATIIINFHEDGMVRVDFPTNMQICGTMLGSAIKSIMDKCQFQEPSRIMQVPPGTKLTNAN